MKLWLVLRKEEPKHDHYRGFVIRAESEDEVWQRIQEVHRMYVERNLGDAGNRDEWLIEELHPEGDKWLALYDFLHG